MTEQLEILEGMIAIIYQKFGHIPDDQIDKKMKDLKEKAKWHIETKNLIKKSDV